MAIEAEEHTVPGLVRAISEHFAREENGPCLDTDPRRAAWHSKPPQLVPTGASGVYEARRRATLWAENRLDARDFIYPLFVRHGEGIREEISSMPGRFHLSIDQLDRSRGPEGGRCASRAAVRSAGQQDGVGSEADDEEHRTSCAQAKAVDPLARGYEADVCLCEYTSHGHCGVLDGEEILNDESVELLARTSVSLGGRAPT